MSGRFAEKNHLKPKPVSSSSSGSGNTISIPTHLLIVAVVGLVGLGLLVGVVAQGPGSVPGSGSVSHNVGDIDFTQAMSGWPTGWPAPITPTVAGVPVPEPLATMQKFVQAAAWGTGSGVVAEHAVTATTATTAFNSGHLETWTLAQVLAAAGGNDVIYMKCPIAGGPALVSAPGQVPYDLHSQVSSPSAADCPGGVSDIACPTIGGTAYTSKGYYFEPNGLGLTYTLNPVYASGTIINYDISFFAGYVGNMVNVCTKNA